MNVLILHSRYLSGAVSGENRVVEDEATLLREGGHHVEVWTPSPPEHASVTTTARTASRAIWSRNAARQARAVIRNSHIDIVHCHNLFPELSPAVLRAVRSEGVPVVMTLHNYRLLCLPATLLRDGRVCEACVGKVPWRGVLYRCYRNSLPGSTVMATSITLHRWLRSFDKVSRFLAVSNFVAEKHIEAGLPREKVTVKSNFAWALPRRTGPGDYFLYVGRLSEEKGIRYLAEAWRSQPLGELLVVGSGPDRDRAFGSSQTGVEFTGDVEPERVSDLMMNARALILPSIWYEGTPRTVLEAYAVGIPVIASRIGSLTEVIADGRSGILVTPHDTKGLAEAIGRLGDDDESERLGNGAWELWNELYSPDRALADLEAAYGYCLGRGG